MELGVEDVGGGNPLTASSLVKLLGCYLDAADTGMPGVSVLSHRSGKTAVLRVDLAHYPMTWPHSEQSVAVKLDGRVSSIRKEGEAYLELSEAGVTVAEVLAIGELPWTTTESGSLGYLITRWVDGHPIAASDPIDAQRQVGHALRKIHRLPATSWTSTAYQDTAYDAHKRSWLDAVLAWWRSLPGAGSSVYDLCDRAYAWFDRVRPMIATSYDTLILFDGRPDHFLVEDGELRGIIDVETLWAGDPAMDLAVLECNAPGVLAGVLDGYSARPEEALRLREVIPFFALLRAVSGAQWTLEQAPPTLRDQELASTLLARAVDLLARYA